MISDDEIRAARIDAENAARKERMTRAEPMEWEKRAQELREARLEGAAEERRRCVEIARIIARDLPDEPSNGHTSAKAVLLALIDLIEGG